MLCKIMAKGLIFRVRQGILIVPFRWLSLLHLTWRAVLDIGVRVRFLLLLRTSRYVCQPPRALREDGGRGAFEREASSTREIHFILDYFRRLGLGLQVEGVTDTSVCVC